MKRWVPLAAGLAGAAVVWTLLPARDATVSEWAPQLGRQEAIQKAIQVASAHGEQIEGWRFAVKTNVNGSLGRAKRRFQDDRLLKAFEALQFKVMAFDGRHSSVMVTISGAGHELGFSDRSRLGRKGSGERQAELEMERLVGAAAANYRRTAESVKTQEGIRSAWEWVDAERPGIVGRVEVVLKEGEVVRSIVECSVPEEMMDSAQAGRRVLRDGALMVFFLLGVGIVGLAIWSLFTSLLRRSDQLRFGMRFVWMAAMVQALALLSGSLQNTARIQSFEEGLGVDPRLPQAVLIAAVLTVLAALILAAGYAAAPRWEWKRWIGAGMVAEGRLWTKLVGWEAWSGVMAGVGLAAIPYVAAAVMGPGTRVRFLEGSNLLAETWPQLEPLDGLGLQWELYLGIVFLLPWLAARVRRHAVRWGVLWLACGVLLSVAKGPFPPGSPANLATGLALAAGWLAIYQWAGVLGLWVSPLGTYATVQGVRLAHLAPVSLREAGWEILAGYGVLAVAALAAARWGKATDGRRLLEQMEENASAPPRSERERLKAEFQVARRAQAGMLPGEDPWVEGFELSAVCEPAREVGGDLFDYLRFSDGQFGVCVADVSGKGVPAALYMTLTKGMLAAAEHGKPDLRTMALRLNRALTAAGKKRVFVTMSIGLLDGERRVVRHIRAGHNPPVLWRSGNGTCEFLKPKGIGLGLTAGRAFERHLEEQEVQLEAGDALVFYSDGLVECMNEEWEQFGEERLEETLQKWGRCGAAELKDRIVEAARVFRGKADPHDDLTVLVVKAGADGRDSIR
ncbi:MAG: PP2C family protein-serine/threonine phosphatase [Acidobacteria bacterium]|nr:PP2C family protein-serine/threonine phosphatase [Acidobacteriota bacterium]